MTHLVEMQREFGERGLKIVGVTKASDEKAKAFAAKYDATTYEIRADAKDTFKRFGVTWVPSTKLISPSGVIVYEDRHSKYEPSSTQLKITLHRRLPKS